MVFRKGGKMKKQSFKSYVKEIEWALARKLTSMEKDVLKQGDATFDFDTGRLEPTPEGLLKAYGDPENYK